MWIAFSVGFCLLVALLTDDFIFPQDILSTLLFDLFFLISEASSWKEMYGILRNVLF